MDAKFFSILERSQQRKVSKCFNKLKMKSLLDLFETESVLREIYSSNKSSSASEASPLWAKILRALLPSAGPTIPWLSS